jgi:hypothetical protein
VTAYPLEALASVAARSAPLGGTRSLAAAVEPQSHPASSGDRPGTAGLKAVGQARERCWRDDWGGDRDLQGVLHTLDHALLMRAGRKHTDGPWGRLSIDRWLKAPVPMPDGTRGTRELGRPQGGVVSPRLATRFWPDTVAVWKPRRHPDSPCERAADEAGGHVSPGGASADDDDGLRHGC